MRSIQETHHLITGLLPKGREALQEELERNARPDLVKATFNVTYDERGHDMILEALVDVAVPDTYLLQVWLQDIHDGIHIPELHPWVSSVVEFQEAQQVTSVHCGIFDSKWQQEDSGQTYVAYLWGYVAQGAEVLKFGPFEKEFVYP